MSSSPDQLPCPVERSGRPQHKGVSLSTGNRFTGSWLRASWPATGRGSDSKTVKLSSLLGEHRRQFSRAAAGHADPIDTVRKPHNNLSSLNTKANVELKFLHSRYEGACQLRPAETFSLQPSSPFVLTLGKIAKTVRTGNYFTESPQVLGGRAVNYTSRRECGPVADNSELTGNWVIPTASLGMLPSIEHPAQIR